MGLESISGSCCNWRDRGAVWGERRAKGAEGNGAKKSAPTVAGARVVTLPVRKWLRKYPVCKGKTRP